MLPDRIAIRQNTARQRLIDHDDFRAVRRIVFIKTRLAKPESAWSRRNMDQRIEQTAGRSAADGSGRSATKKSSLPISCQAEPRGPTSPRSRRARRGSVRPPAGEIHSGRPGRVFRGRQPIFERQKIVRIDPVRARPSSSRLLIVSPRRSAEPSPSRFRPPPETSRAIPRPRRPAPRPSRKIDPLDDCHAGIAAISSAQITATPA